MEKKQELPVKKEQKTKEQKTIADNVLARVNEFEKLGEIKLPKDYNAGNALKAAWLILQDTKDKDDRPVLGYKDQEGIHRETCTKESIANALFEMVITGLSPTKKQCSFIAYGTRLTCHREYAGNIALAKRFGNVKDVTANVIYEGDVFTYTIDSLTGRKKVNSHVQDFKNIDDNKIKGAYATLILEDGTTETEIMSIAQIQKAWMQGAAKGNSPAHRNFPGEMAKKTVIYRACKIRINSSDDGVLGSNEGLSDPGVEASDEEIMENANTEEVSFEEVSQESENQELPEENKLQEVEESGQQKIGPGF